MKRQCNNACGTKTKQTAVTADNGAPVWECLCCGAQTPRRARRASEAQAAQAAALDNLFESLTEGL